MRKERGTIKLQWENKQMWGSSGKLRYSLAIKPQHNVYFYRI